MDHGVRVLDGDHWGRVHGCGDVVDICINIIVKSEARTESFVDSEAWNAVDDHLEHSDGDELGDDGEEGGEKRGEEALEDGEQLRGPDTGQGGQGEADDTAESWSRQDHDAGTGA